MKALIAALVLLPAVAHAEVVIYGAPQSTALVQYTWRPDLIRKRPEGLQSSSIVKVFENRDLCDAAKRYADENLRARGYQFDGAWWLTVNPATGSTIGVAYACEATR